MKFRWNKNYLGWGLTAFAVIIASLLVYAALSNFKEIAAGIGNFLSALQPILYGLVIAYLLAPIVAFFETRVFNKVFRKSQLKAEAAEAAQAAEALKNGEEHYHHLRVYVRNKKSRICSILVSVLILFGVIVGICFAILPQLNTTISLLVENIPEYVKNITTWVQDIFSAYPEIGTEITNIVNEASASLKSFLTTSILPQMGDYLGFLTNGIMSIVGFLMNLIFGLVVSIYCLYSKELFSAQIKKFIYCIMKVKHANSFIGGVRKIHKSFGSFITGTLIDSFVVACITFVVTTIFGVPFSLLVSVIMGVTNIIPYFGP
ncbi:MAG: AI-2E family transporter, partial [Ruminiclostridium sp.]